MANPHARHPPRTPPRTRPGEHVAFAVGEIRKNTIHLETPAANATGTAGFKIQKIHINAQPFTKKTSNIWGITNNTRGTNTNRILLL